MFWGLEVVMFKFSNVGKVEIQIKPCMISGDILLRNLAILDFRR